MAKPSVDSLVALWQELNGRQQERLMDSDNRPGLRRFLDNIGVPPKPQPVQEDPWLAMYHIARMMANFFGNGQVKYPNLMMGDSPWGHSGDVLDVKDVLPGSRRKLSSLIEAEAKHGYEPATLMPVLRWWYAKGRFMENNRAEGAAICIPGTVVDYMPPSCSVRQKVMPILWCDRGAGPWQVYLRPYQFDEDVGACGYAFVPKGLKKWTCRRDLSGGGHFEKHCNTENTGDACTSCGYSRPR